jgi:Domain of unknown function (DUF4131)
MLGCAPRQLRPMSTLARPLLPLWMNTAVVATIGEGLAWFAAERDRWILWIPVLMGFGVAIYFGLPGEPPAWVGPSLAIGAAVSILVLLGRAADRSTWLRPAGAGVLAMIAGFAAAQAKAVAVGTEMLSGRLGPTLVTGRVERVENFPDGQRLTLHRPTVAGLSGSDTPEAARIRLRGGQPAIRPGDRISLRAVLGPPPPPAVPGGYDFQRQAYFDGLGAVGYSVGRASVLPTEERSGLRVGMWFAWLRAIVGERIRAESMRDSSLSERRAAGDPGSNDGGDQGLWTGPSSFDIRVTHRHGGGDRAIRHQRGSVFGAVAGLALPDQKVGGSCLRYRGRRLYASGGRASS